LIAADVQQIPFADESFDYVVSSEVIEHVIEPEKAIHEMCRVLKRGGYLALTTPK
jgi:ubiquinone/menaquinone biosynthesis C-methylase UbiE